MSRSSNSPRTLLRRGLDAARGRFPRLYWRARNAVALAEWYLRSRDESSGPYDDRFWTFHEGGDWAGFARVVLTYLPVRSVVDVGCGHGLALAALAARDPGLRLLGLDESAVALDRARQRGVEVERLDLARLSRRASEDVAHRLGGFDAALCLEVAEHVPPWRAGTLLRVITAVPRVVFSAAHPNQGGLLHVNEQPAEYWIRRFDRLGFRLSEADEAFRHEVAELQLPSWYAQNIHLFERGDRGRPGGR